MPDQRQRTRDRIVAVVVDLLETEGYDGVQLRVVATRGGVSLATIYKLFSTRDELIVAALDRWMQAHTYVNLAHPPADMSLYDGLMWVFRQLFEPWEQNPRMLAAYHRARTGPFGHEVDARGLSVVEPVAQTFLADVDPSYAMDVGTVLTNMAYAVVGRFADGEIEITDILPALERAVALVTGDNAELAAGGKRQRRTPRQRRGVRP